MTQPTDEKRPQALPQAIASWTERDGGRDGFHATPVAALQLLRANDATAPERTLYHPALCMNVQGAKRVMLGDKVIDYGEMQALAISVDLPMLGRVTAAAPGRPFLAMVLDLDLVLLREVAELMPHLPAADDKAFGASITDITPPMADCALRLIRLLAMPEAIPVLAPTVIRELYFWVLSSPAGTTLRRLTAPGTYGQRIARAVHAIRESFTTPLRVTDLAHQANMSPSAFHQHFKAVTAMSPLQYQKQLRLLEARRLMLAENAAAAVAAFRVGYESASQFSREYTRMFGAPPRGDIERLRGAL